MTTTVYVNFRFKTTVLSGWHLNVSILVNLQPEDNTIGIERVELEGVV